MTDTDDRFAAMRPPTDADHDWADSDAGRMTLARIHHRAARNESTDWIHLGRRWLRPVLVVSAAAVAVAGATAAVVIISRSPTNPAQVVCLRSASTAADGAGIILADPTPAAALQACSTQWTSLFPGDTKPRGFAVCVYPVTPVRDGRTEGGGQVVIPAASTSTDSSAACTAAGFDPITTS